MINNQYGSSRAIGGILTVVLGLVASSQSWGNFNSGTETVTFNSTGMPFWRYSGNNSTPHTGSPNHSQNNTFNAGLIIDDSTMFNLPRLGNEDSGNYANTIAGGMTVNVSIDMTNEGSTGGSLTTNITGGLILNSSIGLINLAATSNGTMTNTIDSVTLNGPSGYFQIGGNGSTTTVTDTFEWNDGGTLQIFYINGDWGETSFNDVMLAGSPKLSLRYRDGNSYSDYTNPSQFPSGVQTIFTVNGTLTGDPSTIQVESLMSFTEITHVAGAEGAFSDKDGQRVVLNFGSAATTGEASGTQAVVDQLFNVQVSQTVAEAGVGGGSGGSEFVSSSPSPHTLARMRLNLKEAMRSKPQSPWENLVSAMSETDSSPKVMKFKGDYRVWAVPYSIYARNTGSAGAGTGFTEKDYGMLFGGSHFVKSMKVGVSGLVGFGLIDQQMSAKKASKTKGKQFIMGLMTNKRIFTDYEWISSLYGIAATRDQDRQGNPSATQSYVAKSSYKTYLLSFQNELGRVFKLEDNWSVRPLVGLQMAANKRQAFSERLTNQVGNVPDATFAQRYKAKTSITGEVYTGMGVRKKWDSDRFEGKVTVVYQVGQKSGNGKARTDVAAGNQSLSVSSATPGRFTQYINVYGSLLDKQSNWKLIPGATVTLQRGQRSITTSLKAEYRF